MYPTIRLLKNLSGYGISHSSDSRLTNELFINIINLTNRVTILEKRFSNDLYNKEKQFEKIREQDMEDYHKISEYQKKNGVKNS